MSLAISPPFSTLYPQPAPPPSLSITSEVSLSALFDVLACVIFAIIALLFVALRIAARFKKGGKFYLNDWAIFWAVFWGTFLAMNSIVAACYGGIGHHMEEIMLLVPDRVPSMLKTFLIGEIAWALANTGVKISLLDLYVKIFGAVHIHFHAVASVLMALSVLYCVMVLLMAFLLCRPFNSNWNPAVKAHCADRSAAYLAQGIINLALDICIIVLPLPILWKLQMPMHKRFGLMVMLSGGFVICGISIWRIILLNSMDAADPFYDIGYLSATTNIEPLLGATLACLPVTRSLLTSFKRSASQFASNIYGKRAADQSSSSQSVSNRHSRPRSYFVSNNSTNERKNFTRLYDHLYPLADIGATIVEGEDRVIPQQEQDQNATLVTQEWEVAHDANNQNRKK